MRRTSEIIISKRFTKERFTHLSSYDIYLLFIGTVKMHFDGSTCVCYIILYDWNVLSQGL